MRPLTLLVIADPHYMKYDTDMIDTPEHEGSYAIEWVKRAMEEAAHFASPDALILPGDLIEDGFGPHAETELQTFAEAVRELEIPCIALPGNHDGDPERFLRIFGEHEGSHDVNGWNLYTFIDDRTSDDVTTRSAAALAAFEAATDARPVIAIQHNPVYPQVDCSKWPYIPTNADEIMASYQRSNVALSLSGHYHNGAGPVELDGTTYLTSPSIAKAPYPFYLVTLRGENIEARRLEFALPQDRILFDTHTHTHFGYCAIDVHPAQSLERAKLLGLSGIACTEHAGQLYLTNKEYWKQRHVQDPDAIRQAREAGTDRMIEYRAEMSKYRSPSLLMGLEVECDRSGNLNLLDEDRYGWDILLGAVHYLPEQFSTETPAQCMKGFMWTVEKLVTQGVNVLAHPFRFFAQQGLSDWSELYVPVAELLAAHGVAAEINLHSHQPDPEFLRTCLEHGVALTLASDAHSLHEVGALHPHLRMLNGLGNPLTAWHQDGYTMRFHCS